MDAGLKLQIIAEGEQQELRYILSGTALVFLEGLSSLPYLSFSVQGEASATHISLGGAMATKWRVQVGIAQLDLNPVGSTKLWVFFDAATRSARGKIEGFASLSAWQFEYSADVSVGAVTKHILHQSLTGGQMVAYTQIWLPIPASPSRMFHS
jgi:hypothetical protein